MIRIFLMVAMAVSSIAQDHAHKTKRGGIVASSADLHVEIVPDKSKGQFALYFSDAAQTELPASSVLDVTLTLIRSGKSPEAITMAIDDTGESWTGKAQASEITKVTASITYKFRGKPFAVRVPLDARPRSVGKHPQKKVSL